MERERESCSIIIHLKAFSLYGRSIPRIRISIFHHTHTAMLASYLTRWCLHLNMLIVQCSISVSAQIVRTEGIQHEVTQQLVDGGKPACHGCSRGVWQYCFMKWRTFVLQEWLQDCGFYQFWAVIVSDLLTLNKKSMDKFMVWVHQVEIAIRTVCDYWLVSRLSYCIPRSGRWWGI